MYFIFCEILVNKTSLSFDEQSINWIAQHDNLILIIDIAYLGGES